MKTLKHKRFLAGMVFAAFAVISAVCCLFTFRTQNVSAETLVSQTFVMEDGVSAKLSDKGGIRFRVKMDETTKDNVVNNNDVTLEFVVAPEKYFTDGIAEDKGLVIPVDESKIYTDGDGIYYANGCITNIKQENRALNFQAIARIRKNGNVTDKTPVNANARNNLYSVLNSAVLDTENDYEKTVSGLTAYEWFGTESYPVKISNNAKYANLKSKKDSGFFKNKYYAISTDVSDFNASELSGLDNIESAKWYGIATAPVAKDGLTYNGSAQTLVTEGSAGKGTVMYKVNDGEWSETIPSATNAGSYTVYYKVQIDDKSTAEQSVTVNIAKAQNTISEITVNDITHGDTPNPQNVSATYGEVVLTYANADKSKTGTWEEVYDKPGMYICIATVEESENYRSTSSEKPFTVSIATGSVDFTINNGTLKCGNALDYTANAKGNGAITVKYSRAANGEYKQDIKEWFGSDYADLVGNGYTYYAKAFVESDGCYEDAQSEARSFTLIHDFENGTCKGCGYAQTGITYAIDGEVAYVTGYSGNPSSEVYVCSTYQGKPVTYVKAEAFIPNSSIKKVVLPESVTELKGGVFLNCYDLEYVDMRGVTKMSGNNNFLNCDKLTTVIIGNGYTADDQQFVTQTSPFTAVLEMFVNGKSPVTLSGNDKLVKSVYYKADDGAELKCMKWNFNANGEIEKNDTEHSYTDGKCVHCGLYGEELTKGVTYAYDSNSGKYYVVKYTGSLETVNVLGTYNDGEHGEKAVTYVANGAFKDNKAIKKVILPESVTSLGGGVFMHCTNLEYVDMRGVESLIMTGATAGPDGSTERNNNFLGCGALKIIVVGKGFNSDVGQFHETNSPDLYVYGAISDGVPTTTDINKVGNTYYYSESEAENCWHYDANGNAVLYQIA